MCLCYCSFPLTIISKTVFYLFSSHIFSIFGSIVHLEGFFITGFGILCAFGILYQSIASHLEVVEMDIDHTRHHPKLRRVKSTVNFVKVTNKTSKNKHKQTNKNNNKKKRQKTKKRSCKGS